MPWRPLVRLPCRGSFSASLNGYFDLAVLLLVSATTRIHYVDESAGTKKNCERGKGRELLVHNMTGSWAESHPLVIFDN